MPSLSQILAHKLTDHGVDLLRVASGVNASVRSLLEELDNEIVAELVKSGLSASAALRLKVTLRDVEELINNSYGGIDDLVTTRLMALAQVEAAAVSGILNTAVGVSIMEGVLPATTLKALFSDVVIQGAPSSAWWARQADNVIWQFATEVRKGMAAGETNGQLVSRIRGTVDLPGLLDGPRRNAEALVRTSVQTVANSARLATFRENADLINGVQQISTLDDRTTEICIAYDMACWDLDGDPIPPTTLPFVNADGSPEGVPRHWNCRSTIIPLVKSWEELGVNIKDEFKSSARASMDGEVASDTSFAKWFEGKTTTEQNDILGAGKAQLWRDGKITVRDLLDQTGRPLTLSELEAKHGVD